MSYSAVITKLLIVVMVLSSIPLSAADATLRKRHSYRNHSHNPWSFQFAFDGRADRPGEDEFDGARLSFAYDIDRFTSIRLSLGGFNKGNGFNDGEWISSDRFVYTPFDFHTFDVDGGYLSFQYLFYPARTRKLDFYFGLGPRLSAEEGDAGTLAIRRGKGPFQTVDLFDTDRAVLLGTGVESSFGLEWFLGRSFSLIGEYGFVVQHQWYLIDVDYIDDFGHTWTDTESFSDGLHFDSGHIKLGMAIHF